MNAGRALVMCCASTLAIVATSTGCGEKAQPSVARRDSSPGVATQPSPRRRPSEGAKTYEGLRNLALRAAENLKPRDGLSLIGLVVDLDLGSGTATVALFDGSASLYLSSGGGVIGAGFREPARSKAKQALEMADTLLDESSPTDSSPLPGSGMARFNFVTTTGVRAVEAPIQELDSGTHRLSPLFRAVDDVISEIRKQSDAKDAPAPK